MELKAKLRPASERVPDVLDGITDGFIVMDPQWRITYVNRRAEEILRPLAKTRDRLLGSVLWSEFPGLQDTPFEEAYRRAMRERVTTEVEAYFRPLDAWFIARAYPSADGLSLLFHDVTRRKEAEMRLASERAVLELIADGAPFAQVLETLAAEAERQSTDGMLCSILLLDPGRSRLLHGAAPSLPQPYNEAIHGIEIGPRVGSCGTAAYGGKRVCVTDIASDPLWADFKALALSHGLRACTSTPIVSKKGAVLGTVAMYYRAPRAPSARDEQIIGMTARLAAIAIERKHDEETLRSNEERLRATFEQATIGITVADTSARVLEMNRKYCEILRYPPERLRTLSFRDLTHPADLAETEVNLRKLQKGEISDYTMEKRYLRGDGSEVWCRVRVSLLRDAAGQPWRFLGVIEDISERRRTEEALRRSEQFNRSIIASSRDCIKTLTLDGVLVWISESGHRALCIDDPSTVIGKSWIDFWTGEDREAARAAVEAASRGESGSFVGRFTVNGQLRWWDVVVSPIRDASGRPESLLAVSRDVTERVEADMRLREREAELRQLANLIPQLAWMAGPDGDILWYNERWYEYTGTTFEEMRGWGWRSVHRPEMLPEVEARWKRSLAAGEPFEMEFPLRGRDGTFRWFLTRVNPMRDGSGRVVRWFGTNTDVEQVKRIQHALEEETRMLELLNKTGTSLSANLDLETLLQSITDAATQLSGAQFGAFFYNVVDENGEAFMLYTLSGAPRAAFEKLGQPRATPVFGPTFRGEGVIRSDDITRDARYGKWGPHHGMPKGHLPVRSYLAVPVTSRSGEVIGGLFFGHSRESVFTDRSERLVQAVAAQAAVAVDNARLYDAAQRAAEERKLLLESERHARTTAEHASRMKDEFLATLSHELRTPLGAILGWAHVLRTRSGQDPELQKGLETIERNARTQTQLIDDLLDMSRIISGKLRLDAQSLRPVGVVEAALETVAPAAHAKGIRIERVLDPNAGPVMCDPARLQQVVWNLLNNAIKFTPREGKVHVSLARVNSHVEITVADTGVGIDPEFLPHVFERFRQADASTTRKFGGLGLGLSIVKHLVELHGGSIHAYSEGIGRGTRFVVHLPVVALHQHSDEGPREHPTSSQAPSIDYRCIDLSGVKVLIVDDEADTRELLGRVLGECHAEVIGASHAQEALALIEAQRPNLLVSDIGMPDVDGYELLRRVRALGEARGGRIPAVALTAFARSEDRTRALRSGFQVHVAKPVEPAELVATIASVIGRTMDGIPWS
jgi:PAS domain S-box-containing protein